MPYRRRRAKKELSADGKFAILVRFLPTHTYVQFTFAALRRLFCSQREADSSDRPPHWIGDHREHRARQRQDPRAGARRVFDRGRRVDSASGGCTASLSTCGRTASQWFVHSSSGGIVHPTSQRIVLASSGRQLPEWRNERQLPVGHERELPIGHERELPIGRDDDGHSIMYIEMHRWLHAGCNT